MDEEKQKLSLVTTDCDNGIIVDYWIPKKVEVTIEYSYGWNLVSLPVYPLDTVYFSELMKDNFEVLYKYVLGGGYVRIQSYQSLEVGVGYWAFLENPEGKEEPPFIHTYIGTEILGVDLQNIGTWGLLGSATYQYNYYSEGFLGDIFPAFCIYTISPFNGYIRISANKMETGKAYWAKFISDNNVPMIHIHADH